MIPIRDCMRPKRFPYVNIGLIIFTVAIFLWELTLSEKELIKVAHTYGLVPVDITLAFKEPGSSLAIWGTLLSSVFLHNGWLHIMGNMLYLWVFGDNVEDRLGHGKYLLFYLAVGVIGGLVQVYSDPYAFNPVIGASGAVAGVLGAYVLSFPRAKVETLVILIIFVTIIRVPAFLFILFWFALQLFNGLAALAHGLTSIAWWAHIGGFLGGLILLLVMRPPAIQSEEIDC